MHSYIYMYIYAHIICIIVYVGLHRLFCEIDYTPKRSPVNEGQDETIHTPQGKTK